MSRVIVLPILPQPVTLLILTLVLNIVLQQYLGLKRSLSVVLRPKVSILKGLGLFQYC